MTDTPVRIGPSNAKDAVLALLLLPLLTALPLIAFWLGGAIADSAGSDPGGVIVFGALSAVVIGYGVPVTVVLRGHRSGYELLPLAAGVAPFMLPVLLCLGVFR